MIEQSRSVEYRLSVRETPGWTGIKLINVRWMSRRIAGECGLFI